MNGSRAWFDKDFYSVLGVGESASADEIKRAYKKIASKYHPDRNPGDKVAEEKMKDASEAYDVLSDPKKREEYDQMRHMARTGYAGGAPGSGWQTNINFDDLPFDVNDLFGGMFGGGRRRGRTDVEATARISFDDAIRGATLDVDGTKVKIPAGIKDGARVRARARDRDVYVRIEVLAHPIFARNGADLTRNVQIPFTTAALGGTVDVETYEGDTVKLKIPAGTQSGRTFRVKGRGAPKPKGGQGDLLVTVQVAVPEKLSSDERELIEKLAALNGDARTNKKRERV